MCLSRVEQYSKSRELRWKGWRRRLEDLDKDSDWGRG